MFSWMSGKDKFAKDVIAKLKGEPTEGKWSYEKDQYCVRLVDGKGTTLQQINLENFYKEYERMTGDERTKLLDKVATMSRPPAIPDNFEQAAANVLPHIKPRWDVIMASQSLKGIGTNDDSLSIPQWVLADHFSLLPVYDLPHGKVLLHSEQLQRWGKQADDVIDRACANLLALTAHAQFESVTDAASGQSHVYVSLWRDDYDAARIVFLEMLQSLPVDGDLVVALASHSQLMLTGANSTIGLTVVATALEDALSQPNALPPLLITLKEGAWSPYKTAPSHPLHWRFKKLEAIYFTGVYEQQKALLNEANDKNGVDLFVGSYVAIQAPDGKVGSYCTLTQGVTTLLPKTDYINFVRVEGKEASKLAGGRWDRVAEILGPILSPTGDYPPRFLATGFPNKEQLARIGDEDMFPAG